MLAAVRQAACISQRGCGGLLQQSMLPALTFQLTSLTSLSGLSSGTAGGLPGRQPAAAPAASGRGLAGLLPTSQHLQPLALHQQRQIFSFADGFGDNLNKAHHERKLLG